MGDVAVGQRRGDLVRHLLAEVGEVVAVAAAVEDALGVVDLAVAQEVDDGVRGLALVGTHGVGFSWAAAAARAASGRASSTV